ncbi:MAG: RsmB/NOP family class I SAM-dependent RNA methyltransferase [Spirochaetaceae bacterium]
MGNRGGRPGFEQYYESVFSGRWPELRTALLSDPAYAELGPPLTRSYYLDDASRIAAESLPLEGAADILDMCAAPGGKALVLAAGMDADARLVANERSAARRERLRRVLDDHLPPAIRGRVTVTGHDATKWGLYEQHAYDRILLDVPCSSERHLLSAPEHLERWTKARTRHLAVQAFAMLAAAIDAARPGGLVLYSTCALSPEENDGVIDKAEKRRAGRFRVRPVESPWAERTRHGYHILPDSAEGRGPIYVSLLEVLA